ncbi:DNA-binding NtrC family response regulator [Sphingomonas zeicaulis]|uniref:sigma-54-dependent transcriptional regulator n=1 Tax=Sphingomonas zeicaulis TaxID=1632740 RepID=UPI003D220DCE
MPAKPEFDLCVVVDDDEDILVAARLLLRQLFAEVRTFSTPDEAMTAIAQRSPDLVLLDANFARGATDAHEGLAWLGKLLAHDPEMVIVMITAHVGLQVAIAAMKQGATDFISKPWSNERLLATARTAAALRRSRRTVATERGKVATIAGVGASTGAPGSLLLGASQPMRRVGDLIARAAPTEANVLILGENGTGKELVARELHRQSRRADKVMLTVDLGAISEELIDSELFGHVKGAFTDARTDRIGRIQAADGGTLFLDEIGNLPLHLQPKLLTVLEQRKVTPVGANQPIPVDIRVIAATNLSPDRLGDERVFRTDLLFRLNTVEIELPPLRQRRDDIPQLLTHFLDHYAKRYNRPVPEVSDAAMAAVVAHDWIGNVRALRHAVERAVILAGDAPLAPEDFPLTSGTQSRTAPSLAPPAPSPAPITAPAITTATAASGGEDLNLDRAEKRMVESALRRHGYNISLAAADLGVSRAALYRRMEKYGL